MISTSHASDAAAATANRYSCGTTIFRFECFLLHTRMRFRAGAFTLRFPPHSLYLLVVHNHTYKMHALTYEVVCVYAASRCGTALKPAHLPTNHHATLPCTGVPFLSRRVIMNMR